MRITPEIGTAAEAGVLHGSKTTLDPYVSSEYPHNKIIFPKFEKEFKPYHVLIHGVEYEIEDHDPKWFTTSIEKVQKIMFPNQKLKYKGFWNVDHKFAYVWHSLNPNRELGHKDYVCLGRDVDYSTDKVTYFVFGYDLREMKKHSMISALGCRDCKTICWSLFTHDYHGCKCRDDEEKIGITVDGGISYFRCGWGTNSDRFEVNIDCLEKILTEGIRDDS